MQKTPRDYKTTAQRKSMKTIALYAVVTLVLLVAWLAIIGSLFFGDLPGLLANTFSDGAEVIAEPSSTATADMAVAAAPSSTPTPTATIESTRAPYFTPTPEPGGRTLTLSPSAGQIGWWSSTGERSTGVDSFIYAGESEGNTFISALSFDLSRVPPGAMLREVTLRLTGLRADRFVPEAGGRWKVEILVPDALENIVRSDFSTLYRAPSAIELFSLQPANLAVGQDNYFTFDTLTTQWLAQQLLNDYSTLQLRVSLVDNSGDTLFAWDSGSGAATAGRGPALVVSIGAEPATPRPLEIITPTPQPENVRTAAAQSALATVEAEQNGTPTPLPYYVVVATPTRTPMVVTSTPTAENAATVAALSADATAIAQTTGTFTPTPADMITATPTPLATATPVAPLIQSLAGIPPTPTPTPTATPPSVLPQELIGQILFLRSEQEEGKAQLYSLNPATGELSLLSQMWPYDLARTKEPRSPDGRFTAIVQDDLARVPQVKLQDHEYGVIVDLTTTNGWSFDPVWSPQGDKIAFVSQESGNDEIYTISPDGQGMQRLTQNTWEWDKHPTWSPDGNQIVFWSNRDTGRRQLWIMDKDGNNQRKLLESPFHDWNPVWVK